MLLQENMKNYMINLFYNRKEAGIEVFQFLLLCLRLTAYS